MKDAQKRRASLPTISGRFAWVSGNRPSYAGRLQLLFKTKRGLDALELVNIPMASQLVGDVGRQAVQIRPPKSGLSTGGGDRTQGRSANPGDFQERLWLVRVLLESGHQPQAETALREAVALSKSDPDRWISLVLFMILTKQPDKAEQAIRDAEGNLPKARVALTLAQGCELIGRIVRHGHS